MSSDQALLRLGGSTADAVKDVLEIFAPGAVNPGVVSVVPAGTHPLADIPMPAVLADVSYVDGVTGGNVLVMSVAGARRLATVMMGMDPEALEPADDLTELEYSAVGEAMNQMMSAAAMATSAVLDEEVEIAPPDVRLVRSTEEATAHWDHAGQATTVTFTVGGAPCTLVQLIPNAFIVRMTRAFEEQTAEYDTEVPLSETLRGVQVRVWAELGRARMPSGQLVGMPSGALVELDREADEAIDLYADGMRVATGRLLVTADGGLAVRIEAIAGTAGWDADPSDPSDSKTLNQTVEV
jgi:flagellar motor switch protein FliN/FliY